MVKNNKITTEKLDWVLSQTVDYKFELLRNHIEISKILLNEILEYEVRELSGDPYSHHKPNGGNMSVGDTIREVSDWEMKRYRL